jgi:hypothetical protein
MRTVRGLLCAAMCLLLGCVAHVHADGHLPGVGSMLIAFGLLGVVCIRLAGRQRGFCSIGLVLGVAQVVLHFWFGVSAAVATASPVSLIALGNAAAGHDHAVAVPGSAPALVPALQNGLHAWTFQMAIGHLLVTLVSAACMAYGERVLWWLARLVVPRLTLPGPRPIDGPDLGALRTGPAASLPARYSVLLARSLVRRGPPAYLAA